MPSGSKVKTAKAGLKEKAESRKQKAERGKGKAERRLAKLDEFANKGVMWK